jgi:hypothetical protein
LNLGQILRDVFSPTKGAYRKRLSETQDEQQRLLRCLEILESDDVRSVREATEEAARFSD